MYRLDHDSGQHDDQAVAVALGTHWLLKDGSSAAAWIRWAQAKAELAEAERTGDVKALAAQHRPAPQAAVAIAASEPVLEGVIVLDPVAGPQARPR